MTCGQGRRDDPGYESGDEKAKILQEGVRRDGETRRRKLRERESRE